MEMSAYDASLTLCQKWFISHDSKYYAKSRYDITSFKNQWIYKKFSKSWTVVVIKFK